MDEEWVTATFGSHKGKPKEMDPKEALESALQLLNGVLAEIPIESPMASRLRRAYTVVGTALNKL